MTRGFCPSTLTLRVLFLLGVVHGLYIIGYPSSNARVGYTYTIEYTPASNTPTTFALIRGANEENVSIIATSVTGGSFTWTIPENLMEYGAYYLKAEQEGAGKSYSRAFPISGGPPNTMSFSGFMSATAPAIQPTGSSALPTESATAHSTNNSGLSTGAKAGIAVGAVGAASVLAVFAFLLGRCAGKNPKSGPSPEHMDENSSPRSQQQPIYSSHAEAELEQEKRYVEMDTHRVPREVQGNGASAVT
ncbi:uncharacterized protein M421DRAFT_246674 [Didymella exigua CBS 183.55]|uniref:Yeast cell wall synthesis Kre9/Knh1-like N-terminal domain-containing protein n=1 Tax=Didymella exigua CBS 183.55 TaxID=1150837 RepID=A0A6A5RW18_9PLEO|nr:uncharacterized protein M421DRAFT_246674 [Didymella exigua CBS 183.55]KAF1932681.1 hypothetical protein M421DRAFT_246674 [Didymella exigua CBS 183.55]